MKRWMACVFLIALLGVLVSCYKPETSTVSLLEEKMAKIENLPVGKTYRSDAEAGEDGHFSKQLMITMYGERAEELFGLIEEYVIFLSSRQEPCEIAIFRCYTRNDADRIAEMCLSRSELLRIALAGTPYRERVDGVTVEVRGRVVTMAIVP